MHAAFASRGMEGPEAFARSASRPIIKELVRTKVCFPKIQLLVDRILLATVAEQEDGRPKEAFRLYLSDGEKSIQALVRRRLYKMIIAGDVCEGSYLLIKEYTLESAERTQGDGAINYILLQDFYPIGFDGRSSQDDWTCRSPIKRILASPIASEIIEPPQRSFDTGSTTRGRSPTGLQSAISTSLPQVAVVETDEPGQNKVQVFKDQEAPSARHGKRKREDRSALEEIDSNSQSSPTKKIQKLGRETEEEQPRMTSSGKASQGAAGSYQLENQPKLSTSYANRAISASPASTSESVFRRGTSTSRPTSRAGASSRPVHGPLRLLPLAALRGHRRRNDIYDVFGVIYSVSDMVVKRSRMPAKRDIRIVDPSTDKKVLLSVFVDPAKFKPSVGQVALMRNLTTHEWDGGMLNAYPKQCEGKEWFIPDPKSIPGCDTDWLREWWTEKVIEEAQEQMKATKENQRCEDLAVS